MTPWHWDALRITGRLWGKQPITGNFTSQKANNLGYDVCLMLAWTNSWTHHRVTGDLSRHHAHVTSHGCLFSPGTALGDPHVTTVDGFSFAFNGIGEFILLRATEFEMQGRATQLQSSHPATVFSSIVAKQKLPESDVIEMRINSGTGNIGKIAFTDKMVDTCNAHLVIWIARIIFKQN